MSRHNRDDCADDDDDADYYAEDVDENGDEGHDVCQVDALQDGAREHRLDDNCGRNR